MRYTKNFFNENESNYGWYTCVHCGKKLRKPKVTVDHILPQYYHGSDETHNLQCLCRSCNSSKGKRLNKVVQDYVKNNVNRMSGKTVRRIKNTTDGMGKVAGNVRHLTDDIKIPSIAKNTGTIFAKGADRAVEGAVVPLIVASVNNLCLVAEGKKDLQMAAKDMGNLAATIAVTGGAMDVAGHMVTYTLKQTSSTILQNIAKSNIVGPIITVGYIVKDSVIKFVNGELDGEEFFEEIMKNGCGFAVGVRGAIIGQKLIPIPLVGAFIGSLIATLACGSVYSLYTASKSTSDQEKLMDVNRIASEALIEMQKQQNIFKSLLENENINWTNKITSSFETIFDGTTNNDVEVIANGLNRILGLVHGEVKFETLKEFDDFFMNENVVLTL